MDEKEFRSYQRLAKRKGLSLSEWARQTLRKARRQESVGAPEKKIEIIRAAARHEFPTADIDTMLAEIQKGTLA